MTRYLEHVATMSGPLLLYLLVIWTSGLGELRSVTVRRFVFLGLTLTSILIIVVVEISADDFIRQAAWHMIGLLGVATLAWGAKLVAKRWELKQH